MLLENKRWLRILIYSLIIIGFAGCLYGFIHSSYHELLTSVYKFTTTLPYDYILPSIGGSIGIIILLITLYCFKNIYRKKEFYIVFTIITLLSIGTVVGISYLISSLHEVMIFFPFLLSGLTTIATALMFLNLHYYYKDAANHKHFIKTPPFARTKFRIPFIQSDTINEVILDVILIILFIAASLLPFTHILYNSTTSREYYFTTSGIPMVMSLLCFTGYILMYVKFKNKFTTIEAIIFYAIELGVTGFTAYLCSIPLTDVGSIVRLGYIMLIIQLLITLFMLLTLAYVVYTKLKERKKIAPKDEKNNEESN